jgi:hypothetical protein
LDIAGLLEAAVDLSDALDAAWVACGPQYNPLLSLKALTYFEDRDVKKLDVRARERLTAAVRAVNIEQLPCTARKRGMNRAAQLKAVAREVVWFKEPEETLADRDFFLAHVMTYGTVEEVVIAQRYFSKEEFRAALENAPAGVFDPRSWAYWNTVLGRTPVPSMPRRRLE